MTTTRNPWFNPQSAYSRPEFTYPGKPLLSHEGFEVYRNPAGSWDYVFECMTVTQRAGFNPDAARKVIDDMLGRQSIHAEEVVAHLRAHGKDAMSFAEYSALHMAGELE